MLKNFRTFQIATKFYHACTSLKFPPLLRDQFARASSSIALNIAEGSGRRTRADQAKSYAIALGSLRECQAIFALEKVENPEILNLADQLGAMLYKLSNAQDRKQN